MTERRYKYLFYVLAAVLLALLLYFSGDAGISCDEVLHYNQSVAVYNYFDSHGADTSALNTPVTNLKYYGQSYDNFVTIISKWASIEDVYRLRHAMSALAGWLVILLTAHFALWLGGYRSAIIALLLFAVSPTFIGHSWNNLKDIPFALGYISSTYFIMRFLFSDGRKTKLIALLLILSLAFTLSIRAGGLIVFCYLLLFTYLNFLVKFIRYRTIVLKDLISKTLLILVMIIFAWLLGIILWPFALQAPFGNVLRSYYVMEHFPDTFRQIFEGTVQWSDLMPWYYLPKSMLITIPLLVSSGLILFIFFFRRIITSEKGFQFILVLFTILFPLFFVFYEKPNLYSSWRQFLFLYPAIVIVASAGISKFYEISLNRNLLYVVSVLLILMTLHPLRYMIRNHPYEYIYYNELTGGTKGAFAKYELDYYYVSQTRASEWLIDYLEKSGRTQNVKVKATYSVDWQFRKFPGIETSYFRWQERSMEEWDYAIVVNRYIPPFQLINEIWPPENAIHIEYADNVPICAVVERRTNDDLEGYRALKNNNIGAAEEHFKKALKEDISDEMIFYNFAAALIRKGDFLRADSLLKSGLALNPDSDVILMYLGNIAKAGNRPEEAAMWYKRLIKANRKYFEAYVGLADVLKSADVKAAREALIDCLRLNPLYKPAIVSLADTYRESHPDIAAKYDKLAETIK